VPAPSQSAWSEVGSHALLGANLHAGVAAHSNTSPDATFRVADDVLVPANQQWNLTQAWYYIYAPGWTSTSTPPVIAGNARLWSGPPGDVGSGVLFGDASTNALIACEPTDTFRVFSTTVGPAITSPDTTRRIWRVRLGLPANIGPGTAWLDVQLTPADPAFPVYIVPATIEGERSLTGWNSRQFARGLWGPLADPGKEPSVTPTPVDIAFVLEGDVSPACDSVDFNRDGVYPDAIDLADFLIVFSGGACPTPNCNDIDFNNDSVAPDSEDIAAFLRVFGGGSC
jgi:hypothetical protein